jgi:hypothetical protein
MATVRDLFENRWRAMRIRVGAHQDEVMRRVHIDHLPTRAVARSGPDEIVSIEMLVFGQNPINAVDPATHEVLERVIAVEAAPTLPDLNEPRPDLLGWRVDRDRSRVAELRHWHEPVTRKGLGRLLICGAPPVVPAAQDRCPDHTQRDLRSSDKELE